MTVWLRRVGRLFGAGDQVLEGMELLLVGGTIQGVGPEGSLKPPADALDFDCGGRLLTPGLVDAHTHPLYARPRLEEIRDQAAGVGYAELARRGGGIAATVRQTRAAPWPELEGQLRSRLRRWLEQGTTTVEAKTGYWLEEQGELQAVRVLAALAEEPGLPHVKPTLLGAHGLPDEYAQRRSDFVRQVASWAGEAAARGAQFADVFCDEGAFSVDEARQILLAAREQGLGLRLHADELALSGATELACGLGAASADHLLQIGPDQVAALARSTTAATLCPVTALSLGKTPPARELAAAGVTLALGSDHNPGTSGTTSMSFVVWLAVVALGLSVEQALIAATHGGMAALGHPEGGRIAAGAPADLVLWEADHEGGFAWVPGLRPAQVWRGGEAVHPV